MNPCLNYIQELLFEISQGQQLTDPSKIAFKEYSGNGINQQGDIAACLRTPEMNFVELKLFFNGVTFFEGLCVKEICSAQLLNSSKNEISQLFSLAFQSPITPQQIDFIEYPVEKPPTDYYGFITISIILSVMIVLTLVSLFYNYFKTKSKPINKTNSGQQESNTSSDVQISGKLNQKEEQVDEDLEGSLEKKLVKKGKVERNQELQNESTLIRILQCWNLKSNLQKTFNITVRNSDLAAFDCIRTYSFLQVMLGHCFFICLQYYSNLSDFDIVQKNPFTLFVFATLYAVDVFFMLGGFFLAYVVADPKVFKNFQIKNFLRMIGSYFLAIVNRISRILPTYFITIYIYWQLLPQIGQSPTWSEMELFSGLCDADKWKKVLFIDNLYEKQNTCVVQGWYLANDIQMFIFSLILMIVYANNKFIGKIVLFLALAAFTGLAIYFSFDYELLVVGQLTSMYNTHWYDFYYRPWCRIPPYILGLIFGVFYKEYQLEKYQNNNSQKKTILMKISHQMKDTCFKWISYSIGMVIVLLFTFGPRSIQINGIDYWNLDLQHFLFAISRVVYTFGVILVLLPSVCGSKDIIVKAMSSSIFQFLSKLTFQGFLYHYAIETYTLWSFFDTMYLNVGNVLNIFIAEVVIVFLFAFLFYVLLELPLNNLANIVFNKNTKKKQISKEERKSEKVTSKTIN